MDKNRRRQYFINKDYQTRFIARFAIITMIWSAAAVSLFTWFAGKRLEEAMYSSHLSIASASDLILPSALHAQCLALLLYSLLLAYAIHNLGKKISAPLFMLRKDIARIGAGDLVSPVALRPEDDFQDLASDVEGMRKELAARFTAIKEAQRALSRELSDLDRAVLRNRPLPEHIDRTGNAAARFKEALHAFTR